MRLKTYVILAFFILGCNRTNHEKVAISSDVSLADSCYTASNYQLAIKHFSKAMESGDSLRGELHYKRGFAYKQLQMYDNSKVDLLKAVSLHHREADAYFLLGKIEVLLNRNTMALNYFKKSLEFNPLNEDAKSFVAVLSDSSIK